MSYNFGIQDTTVASAVNTVNYDNRSVQYLIGASTIDPNYSLSYVINTGGTYNINLPNGNYPGQTQNIIVFSNPALASNNVILVYNDAYGNPQTFIFGNIGDMFLLISTTLGWQTIYSLEAQSPVVLSSTFTAYNYDAEMLFEGTVVSQGTSPVSDRGVVYNSSGNPTIEDNYISSGSGLGLYSIIFNFGYHPLIYARAYAINSVGISYGPVRTATPNICLAKGTIISLANGDNKKIEDVTYEDDLIVWNFDDGCFDIAKPLWIKIVEKAKSYNKLVFNDGTILRTINQHRIFNKELGKFTYPMTDDTPIGTTTFNVLSKEITLKSKEVIKEEIEYYNVVTKHHINLFADGILVSCRYNNIYPIDKMKFVKDNRNLRTSEEFQDLSEVYLNGLRLREQQFSKQDITIYIENLEKHKKLY